MDILTAAEILATATEVHHEPVDLDYWAAFSLNLTEAYHPKF